VRLGCGNATKTPIARDRWAALSDESSSTKSKRRILTASEPAHIGRKILSVSKNYKLRRSRTIEWDLSESSIDCLHDIVRTAGDPNDLARRDHAQEARAFGGNTKADRQTAIGVHQADRDGQIGELLFGKHKRKTSSPASSTRTIRRKEGRLVWQ
jgi:hypothetical protein